MDKYGFDYFVKRAGVINEMARPVSVYGGLPLLQEVYKQLLNKAKEIYGSDNKQGGSRQLFAHTGILYHLLDRLGIDIDTRVYVRDNHPKATTQPLEAVRKVTQDLAADHPELANSRELYDEVTAEDNLNKLVALERSLRTGTRKQGRDKDLEEVTGVSQEEFVKASEEIKPYLAQVKTLSKNWKREDDYTPKNLTDDGEVSYAEKVVSVMEELIDLKLENEKGVSKIKRPDSALFHKQSPEMSVIENIPLEDLENTYDMFESMVNDGKKFTGEDMDKLISRISSSPNSNTNYVKLLQIIVDNIADVGSMDIEDRVTDKYPEYDKGVLSRVFDTPEKRKLFENWYEYNKKWNDRKREKYLDTLEQRLMRAISRVPASKPQQVNMMSTSKNSDVEQLIQKRKMLFDTIGSLTDENEKVEYGKHIRRLNQQIKDLQNFENQEEDEESIMSYMTEQVNKDILTNPKGLFTYQNKQKSINSYHKILIEKR